MNWQTLLNFLGPIASALIVALLMRPKTKADTKQAETLTDKLQAEITEKMLAFFRQHIEELNADRENLKAEFAAQSAIHGERERKWQVEKAEMIEQVRRCVEREERSASKLRTIQDSIDAIKLQVALFSSVPEQIRQIQIAIDQVAGNGTPSKDPLPEGVQ